MIRTLALLLVLATPASAADTLLGTWTGDYVCAQGKTALSLTIGPGDGPDEFGAVFHFYPAAENPVVPEGCFRMTATYDAPTRQATLRAGEWLLKPPDYVTVDLVGTLDADGRRLSGQVDGPGCTSFDLRRTGIRIADPARACRHPALSS